MGKGKFGGGGLPGGMGMPANMQSLMKQAQKMQEDLIKKQGELEVREVTTTAGGGVVEVTLSGSKELKSIKIKPEVVDPEDIETLEDLIKAAINEGMRKLSDEEKSTYGGLTGGFNLPF
ncbi:MAG TPA: YbaB/EbfC family nucleoid-associated protein [Clostridiales bacterium]|nr:MAG: nucleoid-associated protein, YbaB/EbfC family [Clostridiales bacterium GWD2_32_19]HCC07731.1 YbaB/EbfC family nucleoid-associated protein [Clostridiales bacterium]